MDKNVVLKAILTALVSSIVSEIAKYLRSIDFKRRNRPKHTKKKKLSAEPKTNG